MKIPRLNINRILSAEIPSGKYGLSPSRITYLADGCKGCEMLRLKLREAYRDSPEACLTLTFNPIAPITGNVLHYLAKYCVGKSYFDEDEIFDHSEELLAKEIKSLMAKWPMLNNLNVRFDFDKVSSLLDSFIDKSKNHQNTPQSGQLFPERYIDCISSLGLCGTPDYLWVNDTEAVIKDYKTGELTEIDGNIKNLFCIQLNLYRLMVCEKYPKVDNVTMYIDNLAGRIEQIPIIQDDELLNMVSDIKKDIYSESFSPGTICNKCQCSHICPNKEWPDLSTQEYFDFMGEITVKDGALYIIDKKRDLTLFISRTENSRNLYEALISINGKVVYLTNLKKYSNDPLICMLSTSSIACEIDN